MSEPGIRIVLNVKDLGNKRTPFDEWEERAITALDSAPTGARKLFQLSEVEVSPAEADAIRMWVSAVPGWSEDYLIFGNRTVDCHFCLSRIAESQAVWVRAFAGAERVSGDTLELSVGVSRQPVDGSVPCCPTCLVENQQL